MYLAASFVALYNDGFLAGMSALGNDDDSTSFEAE